MGKVDSKPMPEPDPLTEPFWNGCNNHELRMPKCNECGTIVFCPSPMCHACNGMEFSWVKLSGNGKVHSFVVVHQATIRGFEEDVPYVVAWIEFPEQQGLKMISNVVDCEVDKVFVGMPVAVVFEDLGAEFVLPKFKPSVFGSS